MALKQHILIAVKPTDDALLHLVNVNSKYSSYNGSIENLRYVLIHVALFFLLVQLLFSSFLLFYFSIIDQTHGVFWHSYVLCGIRGVVEVCKEKKLSGMQLAIAGNVLPNSGLSSSSALVCAAALATSHANQVCVVLIYLIFK